MARQWRLIYDKSAGKSGALNMATDEALLESVAQGISFPVLRLYAWSPPCLSLGYGQRARDVDLERIAAHDWDVVRRPTGGRAILHTDELTYSVMLPADDPLVEGSIVESYQRISRALMVALELLGAHPQSERAQKQAGNNGPVCFETPSHYEITVQGRKLVGSAQLRRKATELAGASVLQHGTLPLTGDITRICDVLSHPNEAERQQAHLQVRARALTLADALGEVVTWEQAADAVIEGFAHVFDLEFELSTLSPSEDERAQQLIVDVYDNEGWTFKR